MRVETKTILIDDLGNLVEEGNEIVLDIENIGRIECTVKKIKPRVVEVTFMKNGYKSGYSVKYTEIEQICLKGLNLK